VWYNKLINSMLTRKLPYAVYFAAVLLAASFWQSSAQQSQPKFLWSWQTNTYVPAGFEGKVLPSPGATVTVSFELVQGGKLANLQGNKLLNIPPQTIYWYANNTLISNIPGKQTVSFTAPSVPGTVTVKVQLPGYPGGSVFQSISVPVVPPEAVIESRYPGGSFVGTPVNVRGIPYFFNVKDPFALNFEWSVNGEIPQNAEDPTNLSIGLNPDAPSGATLNIKLTIQDPSKAVLAASANTTLTYVR